MKGENEIEANVKLGLETGALCRLLNEVLQEVLPSLLTTLKLVKGVAKSLVVGRCLVSS